ncbi:MULTISPECIES: glycerol-3-phosphate 1-O-acyltransferase PlsY [Ruegeria]|jgi:glycerol-3-phosphate acyltransferase PlsY|uniref:Glycerol-3-phosphate acyltransferase n=1 Tax=Ruegeria atlantica TaxID=81569 RepID=A0ABX1WBQ8_9RHOB|nr:MULTISPECIES: glycerol-3-phosphate 1-O-acyltransferase PlsY [Ruegeria]NOC84942.1 glycerol-3-phosphate 1-O-acyltransferase PlsY [Ruegeria sp. HKCCD6428]NOC93552.1 glycerol-3-phosphate 1-O-acyltransferase PlsY [Ruegeria sp. HKCCD6604]NOD30704.1 glycerol-3-phosphate 1-O-acyltransferase PlsY [Ruegeria atlantica]NOE27599.1 glycerol-3-phosphate 1-O-acyltransferase PlsY [Ruegeria sp. HKCCD6157]
MPPIDNSTSELLQWAVVGYLLGSIPFGLLLAKVMGLGNLREIGSGNIGATNVLRTGNKAAAALTLLFDAAKGAAAVLIARAYAGEDAAQIAALFAFLGHCFPIWLGFKGGKGVATFLGLWLALDWRVGVACCLSWLVAAAIWRISSVGALAAAALSTTWVLVLTNGQSFILGIILTLLIYWRHSTNVARIKAGTEPKIGKS